jgi:glycosyltransferase involved in cell wall biosynthesis
MKNPAISVIIPAYNAEQYISEAIKSVIAQTFSDNEIIVVDDGSTDHTRDIVAEFGNTITLLTQTNKGPAAARNCGINHAKGEYIAFLDADDWWFPNKLEKEIHAISENPNVAFVCSDYFCGKNGTEQRQSTLIGYEVWNHDRATFEMMLRENFVNTSTILLAKEAAAIAGLFNETLRGAEDMYFWLRLLCEKDALVIKEVLAFRRYHSLNTSKTLVYNESQLAMVENLILWPIIRNNPEWENYLQRKKNKLRLSLAIRAVSEKRFAAASNFYRILFMKGYKPIHCLLRFILYSIASKNNNFCSTKPKL